MEWALGWTPWQLHSYNILNHSEVDHHQTYDPNVLHNEHILCQSEGVQYRNQAIPSRHWSLWPYKRMAIQYLNCTLHHEQITHYHSWGNEIFLFSLHCSVDSNFDFRCNLTLLLWIGLEWEFDSNHPIPTHSGWFLLDVGLHLLICIERSQSNLSKLLLCYCEDTLQLPFRICQLKFIIWEIITAICDYH